MKLRHEVLHFSICIPFIKPRYGCFLEEYFAQKAEETHCIAFIIVFNQKSSYDDLLFINNELSLYQELLKLLAI